ncbi:aminopeptidase P N-terminal domain-containing protein [soil metagenome]
MSDVGTTGDVYAGRRARLLSALADEDSPGALIVAASPEARVGADGETRYLPAANIYYLTGFTEPDAVVVLCPSADEPFTMFVRPRDAARERWDGARAGEEGAVSLFGADAAHAIGTLGERLPKLVAGARVLYAPFDSGRAAVDAAVRAALAHARHTRPRTGRGALTVIDPDVLLAPLRAVKDAHEIELMRAAARITVDAFGDAVRMIAGAAGEWQVEAALEHGFRDRGADGSAFPPIVAGGANATVLHYVGNSTPLDAGSLLLIDAGARHAMYCADVSRTLPVGGHFSPDQRAVYDVVLAAHAAAIAAVAPDAAAGAVDDAALRVLVDGMIQLGLLSGSVDDIIERKEYQRYFPHRTSHWLGLDVHDVGNHVDERGDAVRLVPGMTLTVEPGLYIPADDASAPAALRGIGVRLEDDVLVTARGCEVLTGRLPIAPGDVEAMLRGE